MWDKPERFIISSGEKWKIKQQLFRDLLFLSRTTDTVKPELTTTSE